MMLNNDDDTDSIMDDNIIEECCNLIDNGLYRNLLIFLGFAIFYILSFLWDIFATIGIYLALSISQMSNCVNNTTFYYFTPTFIIISLFICCFHAIAIVWSIGSLHSKQM